MKKYILIIILLIMSAISYSQNNLPKSTINFGVGIGVPYGGIGFGKFLDAEHIGYMLGFQLSKGPIYICYGYGLVGLIQLNDGPIEPVNANVILMGGMIPLGKKKRTFLDFGLGTSFGANKEIGSIEVSPNGTLFNIGFGYRIGNWDDM